MAASRPASSFHDILHEIFESEGIKTFFNQLSIADIVYILYYFPLFPSSFLDY